MPCNNTCLMGEICGDRYLGTLQPPCASHLEGAAPSASTNTGSPKFPTLEDVRKGIVAAGVCSEIGLDMNNFGVGVAAAHSIICRQLRASA